ncbi:hypothetical protein PQR02_20095 [Paraburkholderia sediminicola]|uniref:Uncharacterized protein n=1 Tax=Paraburkholderia rhynchosiae TaxID=487049 RepID=A0ACC7NHG5_9BURK
MPESIEPAQRAERRRYANAAADPPGTPAQAGRGFPWDIASMNSGFPDSARPDFRNPGRHPPLEYKNMIEIK